MGELCNSHPDASSGFLNLSMLFSPQNLPDLFRSGNTLGVLPFRGFPSMCAEHLSASRTPLDLIFLGSKLPEKGPSGV